MNTAIDNEGSTHLAEGTGAPHTAAAHRPVKGCVDVGVSDSLQ